jgi:hypothetical protein
LSNPEANGPEQGSTSEGNSNTQAAQGNSDAGSTEDILAEDAKYEQERANAVKLKSELTSAQEQLEALQRTQRTAEENQRRDMDRLKKLEAEFDSFKKNTFLELAIGKETKYDWHPNALGDVRNSIDFTKVVFSELKDGQMTVEGLDLELKRIAQEKPYLLKPKAEGQSGGRSKDQGSQGNSPQGTMPSGAHPYGSSTGGKTADTDLLKKYKIA